MLKKNKISGKRSGPPPKSGPNPHIPPVKMRAGGGADMGAPSRAKERAARGYGNPGGGMAATGAPSQEMIKEIRRQNLEKRPDVVSRPNAFSTALRGNNILGSAATFAASKILDIPMAGVRLARNIMDPLSTGRLSTSYTTSKNKFTPEPGGMGLCPDGSNPPCQVVNANTGKSIKVRGVKSAIRGTNFKGVF